MMSLRPWGTRQVFHLCRLLFLCILIFLSACDPFSQTSTGVGVAESTSEIQASPTVASSNYTGFSLRKGSSIRSLVDPLEQTAPIDQPKPIEAIERQVAEPVFRLCSPLVETSLDQLVTIISEPYRPPPPGSEARHHGVDFAYFRKFDRASIEGAGVQAVMDGRVAAAIVDSFPYGNLIIIETPWSAIPAEMVERIQMKTEESMYLLFAHLERPPSLRLGDRLQACQFIGNAGKSGNAGGAHLHFEVRLGAPGARFSGMAYYKAWATDEERSNYLLWRTSGSFRHIDPISLFIN